MDFEQIFKDLKASAERTAKDFDLEKRIEQGKDLSGEAIEKIKTDRNAQIGAIGAGGLLAAALLGTRGGRRFLGGTAKIGAIAGLGALAYHAWRTHQGETSEANDTKEIESAGYVIDDKMDASFAEALVRTMVAAAWADGALNEGEREVVEQALEKAGSDKQARAMLMGQLPETETLEFAASAARSPNHAAQIYAAACLVTGDPNRAEEGFLARLAQKLGIEQAHARAIQAETAA